MRHCVELLKPDGLLVIQTPEFPLRRSYEDLVADDDIFLEHIQRAATEHLYLFSRVSLERLLGELGLREVTFEAPVYSYDMLCVASAAPLRRTERAQPELVTAAATGQLVIALMDAHDAWRASERDRAERLDVIERLDAALSVSEADRQARLEVIERLDAALQESEAERARLTALQDGKRGGAGG